MALPGCENCPERCISSEGGERGRCVVCIKDEQCQSADSPTKTCSKDNKCICGTDKDCPKGTYCAGVRGCVQCTTNDHCPKDKPHCSDRQTCVPCLSNESRACSPEGIDVCTPGTQVCEPSKLRWGACENWKRCPAGQKCVSQKCVPACPPPCKKDAIKCISAPSEVPGIYRTCIENNEVCLVWSDEKKNCEARHVCDQDKCSRYQCPSPAPCTLGKTRCVDGVNFQTCVEDEKGCPAWGPGKSCPEKQECRFSKGRCTFCPPGHKLPCYTGPADTKNKGLCKEGIKTCDSNGDAYGKCENEVVPASKEICNGKDDNCNGIDDLKDGCQCINGSVRSCYTAKTGCTKSGNGFSCKGTCRAGKETCVDGKWSKCTGEVVPTSREICGDGKDNNCDGRPDEGCVCKPGTKDKCGSDEGICQRGMMTCDSLGKWGACVGEIKPEPTELCDGKDNNCNGQVDEAFKKPGSALGTACKVGKGICLRQGVWRCAASKKAVECSVKPGTPAPAELCDGKDNNCDGQIDEAFKKPGSALGTVCRVGVGKCHRQGVWRCTTDQKAVECSVKPAAPTPEVCNGADDNCNGKIDDLSAKICYTGPANTRNVGACQEGKSYCSNGKFTECRLQTLPTQEKCANKKDDDCDGQVDETSGRSVRVQGSSDYVQVPHHTLFNFTGSFTIEMWYNFDGMGTRNIALLLNKHKANENNGYHLKIQTTPQKIIPYFAFSWWYNGYGNQIELANSPAKQWSHIAFVYDHSSKTYRFYINGKEASSGSRTIQITPNAYPLLFSTETSPLGNPLFHGQFSATRISKGAIYNSAFTPPCVFKADANTIAVWNMDDGGGKVIKDLSPNKLNATLVGGAWTTGRACNFSPKGGCVP